MDVFTFKCYDWPMQKADAAFQKNYLKKLRKYRIQAVPAGDGVEGSSTPTPGLLGPQAGHYLEMPEISLNIKEENLALEFEYTAYPRGEFQFDERNGGYFLMRWMSMITCIMHTSTAPSPLAARIGSHSTGRGQGW